MSNNTNRAEGMIKENWSKYWILIVEDDYFNYKLLEGWVQMMNAKAKRAVNGKEAVDMCLKDNDIHIVLMDIQLPGINGYEATRMIKQKRPDLPVIIVTANPVEEEKVKSQEAGCDGFVTKPIDIQQLTITVGKFLPRP